MRLLGSWMLVLGLAPGCGKAGPTGSYTWRLETDGDLAATTRLLERRLATLFPDGAEPRVAPTGGRSLEVVVTYPCEGGPKLPAPGLVEDVLTRQGRLGIHPALPRAEEIPRALELAMDERLGSVKRLPNAPCVTVEGLDMARAKAAGPALARAVPGWLVLPEVPRSVPPGTSKEAIQLWILRAEPDVVSAHVTGVRVEAGNQGPYVLVNLDDVGAARFEALTRRSVDEFAAIVLDDVVLAAPVVREPVSGGSFQISPGADGLGEMDRLAAVLGAPGLPGAVQVVARTDKACPGR